MAKTPKGMQIGASAAPPGPLMNELMALYKAGRFAEVVTKGKPLLRQYPRAFGLWNLIGAASAQVYTPPKPGTNPGGTPTDTSTTVNRAQPDSKSPFGIKSISDKFSFTITT